MFSLDWGFHFIPEEYGGSEKNGFPDAGVSFACQFGEVSGENVSASSGPRGGDRGEATDLGTHTENTDGATLAANTAVDARGGSPQGAHLSGAATPRPPRGRRRQNQNGLDTTQVKTERLTPDNNSTSSRSVTPSSSSHPGTPPNATPLGGPEGPPPPHHLKHMEQMMGRNYSDFMRSLAAKYNNANPNDYFSSPRNGYPPGLDPRFPGFKTGATPFVGLMAPLGAPQPSTVSTTSPLSNKDPKEQKQDSLFGNPVFPPMLDMSSTQALLHMVRTANAAQNAAELETYLKGANKRDAGVTSPLDLSSPGGFAPRKRQRTETRRSGSVSPKPKPTPRPTTPPPVRCPSLCGHMPCGDGQAVNRWTIEDVVNYVSSIDICAEYAQVRKLFTPYRNAFSGPKNFREHRIDGAALPLLSEDHLTGPMGMKLGPALKLRALLARKLGACTVCLHCAHCHQTPLPALNAAAAAAAASQQQHQQQPQQQQLPGRRPSSTGN
ncbi:uncharacterized protein LOC132911088 isoform X1 [Bombus pascuorum]|uniref:uncharacterized protein LOC132911088 isoform X1 n=1 Tax=Bombus pascuorum TaxID=65598 RepID=UPI00298EBC20|nr:uncharacterized protein LOC132911088 isoform X1 [Bombus pascuorum]